MARKTRSYDSQSRRDAAEQTRNRVLDEALRLFVRKGYAATTIAAIAKAARVSVETIYKGFGGKPGLVRAIRDRALAGEGPVHAERRSDAMQARETDPRRIIHAWSKFSAEIAPRASPILLLVRDAAASDREMSELQREMDDDRLRRMNDNAKRLEHLGVPVARHRIRDVLWLATSPEIYELVVVKRGWSVTAYAELVEQLLVGALLTERVD
jgi:AcrR family transcriptional regulator